MWFTNTTPNQKLDHHFITSNVEQFIWAVHDQALDIMQIYPNQ